MGIYINYTLRPISFNTPSPFQVRSEITKHLEIRYLGIVEINVCDNQNDVLRILYAYIMQLMVARSTSI